MKKIPIIIIFLLFLIPEGLISQVYEDPLLQLMDKMKHEEMLNDNDLYYSKIDGTPFLNEDFSEGSVFLVTGESYSGKFRYDIFADQVQFLIENRILCIAFPEKVSNIIIGDQSIKSIQFMFNNKIERGYFITLMDDYYSLYLKKAKLLNDPIPEKPFQPAKPAKFVDKKDIIYFRIGETPALRVNKMKDILNLFPEESERIKNFIDQEKIRVNNDGLIKLVKYLNSDQ